MIPVKPAPEPPDFDAKVRQPGLRAIAERVGEPTDRPLAQRYDKLANHRDELKPHHFPSLWRAAKHDLLQAYHRICAYACLYIPQTTGATTADHFAPKSNTWDRVYEWDNYRLACSLMNSRKRDYSDVIDPFEVRAGMFALDLVSLKCVPGPEAGNDRPQVEATIERLGLNGADYAGALERYYMEGKISLSVLKEEAPFLATELHRQSKLRKTSSP